MRTTVTLDADVEQLLRVSMKERGLTFKEALNSAVRAGAGKHKKPRRFIQKTYGMGAEQLFNWDKTLALAAALEDEEIIRKMALGK